MQVSCHSLACADIRGQPRLTREKSMDGGVTGKLRMRGEWIGVCAEISGRRTMRGLPPVSADRMRRFDAISGYFAVLVTYSPRLRIDRWISTRGPGIPANIPAAPDTHTEHQISVCGIRHYRPE